MINKLPKIELHCHLDGSVRVDTIIDIAKKENIKLELYEKCDVEKLVQVPNDCTSLNEYLKRFDLANKVMQSRENIKRVTFELLEDAQKENVKYKQEKNDFCNLIIDYFMWIANKPDIPKFPDKVTGISKKLYQGFAFVKTIEYELLITFSQQPG